ncbi:hypothetical protein B0H19DRAFT_1117501 [Mycena capillaripes]|nr:hypothetical protein B0H19DRAFT_1117501 [Mycena capillaripes]
MIYPCRLLPLPTYVLPPPRCTVHAPPGTAVLGPIMRHSLLPFILQLLLALLTQVALSSARFGFGEHGQSQIPHPSFGFQAFSGFPNFPGSPTTAPTPSTTKPQPVSTSDAAEKPVQSSQNNVQAPAHDAGSSSSSSPPGPASASAKSSSTTASHSPAKLNRSSSTPSPPPTSSPSTADDGSNSPQTSPLPVASASTKSNKTRMLVEILVPLFLAALVAAAISFAFYRRRRVQDKKEWEGSRLPELNDGTGIWAFARSGAASKSPAPRPRTTYVGGGDSDWNRSDAHLRGEGAYYEHSIDLSGAAIENGSSIPASEAPDVSEAGHSEVGHDYVRAFHSMSPMDEHDEPALAESRPGTLLEPMPVPLPAEGC